jgi:hypothetical protein
METMRESWTDARLDDFRDETARRFDQVDRRFDRVEGRIDALAEEMNARFDSMQRTTIGTQGAVIAALLGIFLTQL